MIWVNVGNQRISLEELREGWLIEQIKRQSEGGQAICVRVDINEGDVQVTLATPACGPGGGGGRPPRPKEAEIFERWRERGLAEPDWKQGHLIAFLKQLRNML